MGGCQTAAPAAKELPFHYLMRMVTRWCLCYVNIFFCTGRMEDRTVIVTFGRHRAWSTGVLNRKGSGITAGYGIFHRYQQKTANQGRKCVTVRVDSEENLNIPPFELMWSIIWLTAEFTGKPMWILKMRLISWIYFCTAKYRKVKSQTQKLISEIEI